MFLAIPIETMKIIIIKAIEAHRLSSPSIESKMNVADIPPITARMIRKKFWNYAVTS